MVEAGETGGILDTILQRLSTYIEKNVKLKRAVKSALVYPIGVLSIAAAVIILLLWKVVPIFARCLLDWVLICRCQRKIVIGVKQLCRQHFRPSDCRRFRRSYRGVESVVRHHAGPHDD